MKPVVACYLVFIFVFAQPASAAAPIVEMRTNPACAQAFHQAVLNLRQMTEVGKRLMPESPGACRDARAIVRLNQIHLRLDMRMYAICHQDGSAELATEEARNDHLQQIIIPRYCR